MVDHNPDEGFKFYLRSDRNQTTLEELTIDGID